jgi:hypothetical protein
VATPPTKIGKDGKRYPAVMPPPAPWRWQAIKLTHALAHEQGLSEPATQRALAARGYRRSAGTIHYDLTRLMPTCARCRAAAGLPEPPPPPPVPARVAAWR